MRNHVAVPELSALESAVIVESVGPLVTVPHGSEHVSSARRVVDRAAGSRARTVINTNLTGPEPASIASRTAVA